MEFEAGSKQKTPDPHGPGVFLFMVYLFRLGPITGPSPIT